MTATLDDAKIKLILSWFSSDDIGEILDAIKASADSGDAFGKEI